MHVHACRKGSMSYTIRTFTEVGSVKHACTCMKVGRGGLSDMFVYAWGSVKHAYTCRGVCRTCLYMWGGSVVHCTCMEEGKSVIHAQTWKE